MHTRACTAGLRPKQTCSNISASAHLQSTKWCLRSNAQGSSADSAASLAVSKCSLIQNTCRSYDEPRSTSQNLCAEVLGSPARSWLTAGRQACPRLEGRGHPKGVGVSEPEAGRNGTSESAARRRNDAAMARREAPHLRKEV